MWEWHCARAEIFRPRAVETRWDMAKCQESHHWQRPRHICYRAYSQFACAQLSPDHYAFRFVYLLHLFHPLCQDQLESALMSHYNQQFNSKHIVQWHITSLPIVLLCSSLLITARLPEKYHLKNTDSNRS